MIFLYKFIIIVLWRHGYNRCKCGINYEKYRQHSGQRKRTNNDLQNITHKTKDRVTRTRKVSSSCSTSDTNRVTLVTNPVISHE